MKIKYFFRQRHYLLRVIFTLCVAVLVPFVIMEVILVSRQYNNFIKSYENYYNLLAHGMSSTLEEELALMRNTSIKIGYEGKLVQNEVEKQKINEVYAIEELNGYKNFVPQTDELILFYDNADYFLSSGNKYSYDYGISLLSRGDAGVAKILDDYFSGTSDKSPLIIGINPVKGNIPSSVYVVCRYYPGMSVLYKFVGDSFEKIFLNSTIDKNLCLALFDSSGNVVYSSSSIRSEAVSSGKLKEFILDGKSSSLKLSFENDDTIVFKGKGTEKSQYTFAVFVPQDEITIGITEYYQYILNIMLIILALLLVLLSAAIYLIYKPVMKIYNSLFHSTSRNSSELDLIQETLNNYSIERKQMISTISEQSKTYSEAIMQLGISGISVSQEELDALGEALGHEPYCIFAIDSLKLDSDHIVSLKSSLADKLGINTFCSYLPSENYLFLLAGNAVKNQEEQINAAMVIESHLSSILGQEVRVGLSGSFADLKFLRSGCLNAITAVENSPSAKIAFYTDVKSSHGNFEDEYTELSLKFLQHVRMGEKELAFGALNQIEHYVLKCASSEMYNRYYCFELLNSYMRTISRIKGVKPQLEIERLLNFRNISDLCGNLIFSVTGVCEAVLANNAEKDGCFASELVSYVDNNFTDPEICLARLSEIFGIPIYSVSRLFSVAAGIGYKDYIISKRIEYSKQLLLTTDKTVKEIAGLAGIEDSMYFAKVFKNITGVSPGHYRKGKGQQVMSR